jgi:hypothetical protein
MYEERLGFLTFQDYFAESLGNIVRDIMFVNDSEEIVGAKNI